VSISCGTDWERGNNATPPTPAVAPGAESIDTRAYAAMLGERAATIRSAIDPRVAAVVPGFDAPFFQAGLAGYSDAAMRIIARRHGCPFCVTEALLDRTLLAGGRGFAKADLGELHDNIPGGVEDHPLACQVMGSDPREMAAACLKAAEQSRRGDKHYRMLAYAGRDASFALDAANLRLPGGEQIGPVDLTADGDVSPNGPSDEPDGLASNGLTHGLTPGDAAGAFQVIDVNLACPVKKISTKARGGHWLAEPRGAIAILEAVRDAVPSHIPCTVKLRRSFDDTPEMAANFEVIFDATYRIGYAWATVHARTVQQKYVGPSRWTFLKDLRARHPDKLIFGSGDVWNVHDIFRMLAYTGMTGVSVARGCIGNPWIFRQAREMLAGRPPSAPTVAQQRAVLDEHFRLLLAVCQGSRQPEQMASRLIRKFGIRFAAHHPRAEEVRTRAIRVGSLEQWQALLRECYDAPLDGPSDAPESAATSANDAG
jgi:tRNA-dihydrouridine synthase